MAPGTAPHRATRRWTPARLIAAGAVLGFGPAILDAVLTLQTNLAILGGTLDFPPYGLVLLDTVLLGLVAPVGFFLVLCGVLLSVRSHHPLGHRRAFRAALGGAGLDLAAGLLLGVLNLALFLLPPGLATADLIRNAVVVLFLGTVVASGGLLLALGGIAAIAREPAPSVAVRPATRVRTQPGKSIYRAAPSAR